MPKLVPVVAALTVFFELTTCQRRHVTSPAPPLPRFVEVTPQDVAGCYHLQMAPWNPPFVGGFAAFYQLPPNFELTMDRIAPNRNDYKIRPETPDPPHAQFAVWRISGPREATLTWSTGFVGVTAVVRKERGTRALVGSARTFTDVIPSPYQTTTLSARRVPCKATPPN